MTTLEAILHRVQEDLDRLGRPWAVVGGLAVSARTEPRMTRDIDVVVAVANDAEAEATILALQRTGYRAAAVVEHDTRKRLATVRLVPPGGTGGGVLVDLLFASSGIESEVAAAAERLELVPALEAYVATAAHLVALKVLARDDRTRPQDLQDLRSLLGAATPAQVHEARKALSLIQARRYDRGRNLLEELDRALADTRAGPS